MPFPDFEPTIPVMLRTVAERHGPRTLLVHGGRRMTYAEVERRSALLASGLLEAGVGKGTRVGLLAPNGADWVVAFLAAARFGALVVPINTFYQARELGWALAHADVELLLTAARFRSHDYVAQLEAAVPDLAGQRAGRRLLLPTHPCLREVRILGEHGRGWAGDWAELEAVAERSAAPDDAFLHAAETSVTPADPLVVVYTSGSTAEPRGAVHTHGTVVRHAFNVHAATGRELRADDRIWSPMPLFWVGGLVLSFLGTMHHGACLLLEDAFDPERTLDLLERERATIATGWPHYGKAMAAHPSFPDRDLSALRSGMTDLLPPDRRPSDPELKTDSLGMTETCGPHTFGRDTDPPHTLRGSFGRALEGVEHKVVDAETGETLPPGVDGEICVRGYSLMQGFHKVERERTFDCDGFYHTGDGGSFDADGFLWFKGRLGDMIKTAGASVAPAEIEKLLGAYPEVKAAYVVGLPDAARGQSVAAAVVLHEGHSLGAEELRSRLKRELAAYKVPRHVLFFPDGALPFTDSGKIDKRKLRDLLVAGLAPGRAAR